ncbi:hypothetical protein BG005_005581, partial [Podila minutissima]
PPSSSRSSSSPRSVLNGLSARLPSLAAGHPSSLSTTPSPLRMSLPRPLEPPRPPRPPRLSVRPSPWSMPVSPTLTRSPYTTTRISTTPFSKRSRLSCTTMSPRPTTSTSALVRLSTFWTDLTRPSRLPRLSSSPSTRPPSASPGKSARPPLT